MGGSSSTSQQISTTEIETTNIADSYNTTASKVLNIADSGNIAQPSAMPVLLLLPVLFGGLLVVVYALRKKG